MHTVKESVQILASILEQNEVTDIVFSPGSRNAPLVIELVQNPKFNCISLPDERCAGFFALGIAQWKQKPVAICCTSGSASLNYAPAIAEAYYQNVPLLVLTADRPREWIDHGEGQSIRQNNVFANYIKGSYNLPQDIQRDQERWFCNRLINEAYNLATTPELGPVHINMPFNEPLYDTTEAAIKEQRIIRRHQNRATIEGEELEEVLAIWKSHHKRMILCGQMAERAGLQACLENIASHPSTAVVVESTANLHSKQFNACIDRSLAAIPPQKNEEYVPEVLITIGGAIVSKKLKMMFRKHGVKHHWHISENGQAQDMFQSLNRVIECSAVEFISELAQHLPTENDGFGQKWMGLYHKSAIYHEDYLRDVAFSDLAAYACVLDYIQDGSVVHMANSTAVRYVQLFPQIRGAKYFCNRGTSGIDGSTSTALGSRYASGKSTILLTGDMSFFYDSNAFWNAPVKDNFKVVLFNNGGGGIFRIIEGPSSTKNLEKFFETQHKLDAEHIAALYGLDYHKARNMAELDSICQDFFNPTNNTSGILEIITPRDINPEVLKAYFKNIAQ